MKLFERDGVRFQYPTNWAVETEDAPDGGWAASVQSPDFAFLVVSLQPEAGSPAEVADQALAALREVYQELDAEDVVETVGGTAAVGHDIDFITADTTVVCRTRCLDTTAGPLLVMTQASELDRERNDPVLRAVVASLTIDL